MQCVNHPSAAPKALCTRCDAMLCNDCVQERRGNKFCAPCASYLDQRNQARQTGSIPRPGAPTAASETGQVYPPAAVQPAAAPAQTASQPFASPAAPAPPAPVAQTFAPPVQPAQAPGGSPQASPAHAAPAAAPVLKPPANRPVAAPAAAPVLKPPANRPAAAPAPAPVLKPPANTPVPAMAPAFQAPAVAPAANPQHAPGPPQGEVYQGPGEVYQGPGEVYQGPGDVYQEPAPHGGALPGAAPGAGPVAASPGAIPDEANIVRAAVFGFIAMAVSTGIWYWLAAASGKERLSVIMLVGLLIGIFTSWGAGRRGDEKVVAISVGLFVLSMIVGQYLINNHIHRQIYDMQVQIFNEMEANEGTFDDGEYTPEEARLMLEFTEDEWEDLGAGEQQFLISMLEAEYEEAIEEGWDPTEVVEPEPVTMSPSLPIGQFVLNMPGYFGIWGLICLVFGGAQAYKFPAGFDE